MIKLKAEWVFSIIKALETREQYAYDELLEDRFVCKEVLEFFRGLEFEVEEK